jgi:16S rRNA (adenine1518-N6/adenine1519-N6)-dimethyltransferase
VPAVVSTFVHLAPRRDAPEAAELARIERLVRAAFGTRRKTLANALKGALAVRAGELEPALRAVGLEPGVRAEVVSPPVWRALAAQLGARPDEAPAR